MLRDWRDLDGGRNLARPSESFRNLVNTMRLFYSLVFVLFAITAFAAESGNHAFLATGQETFIVAASGKTIWTFPQPTRDGWVLDNGNILLAISTSKAYPGGAVAEGAPPVQELDIAATAPLRVD